ncbi:tryptophan 2,3-dioxygenase [Fulvivirga sp. M361]|uniref:tryptophan 2,3-dioxygenase family protein n=1 Tax=Fulvivirga sp. M361 TaxID=2594266 RepID=UPI001179BD68|nr:tryptophan 2,3-dioxygenase family protein [Fulvivirga sp. M361]TRX51312.1 tryptophan 2,3-dioxygenase [Fulvivirga sp. M361]
MPEGKMDSRILEQIKKLEEKYQVMGQDLSSYLDGLLYSDYLTYWDYIHLDTLMSLQTPKTGFKDEMIFIVYHQHTELFFKLVLWEIEQMSDVDRLEKAFFIERMTRVNRYFELLENSFSVMVEGMDRDQFLQFRMSLLPSSGFQSAQYRLIELSSTDIYNLSTVNMRDGLTPDDDIEKLMDALYWKQGATELASGKKTLTLRQFEEKYAQSFAERVQQFKNKNLLKLYQTHFKDTVENDDVKEVLRRYDLLANVYWPLAHYKSAVKYLQKSPSDIVATGGTNWQKYLPPRFQKVIFFPELWTAQEIAEWGKGWVMKEIIKEDH